MGLKSPKYAHQQTEACILSLLSPASVAEFGGVRFRKMRCLPQFFVHAVTMMAIVTSSLTCRFRAVALF